MVISYRPTTSDRFGGKGNEGYTWCRAARLYIYLWISFAATILSGALIVAVSVGRFALYYIYIYTSDIFKNCILKQVLLGIPYILRLGWSQDTAKYIILSRKTHNPLFILHLFRSIASVQNLNWDDASQHGAVCWRKKKQGHQNFPTLIYMRVLSCSCDFECPLIIYATINSSAVWTLSHDLAVGKTHPWGNPDPGKTLAVGKTKPWGKM